jgi:hypothetical protein
MLTLHTSPRFAPEKEYTFRVVLGEMLGVDYRVEFAEGEKNYRLCLPNGATLVLEDHFFEQKNEADYLRAEHVPNKIEWADSPFGPENLAVVFGHNHFTIKEKEARCGLDIFASAFFMLTRWEEYAQPDRDAHGRFPAEKSLAVRADFLHRPVLNEWANLLWQLLQRLGWQQPRPQRQFQISLSCDVDHPRLWWSAAARWKTVAGAIFRRGDWGEARYWLSMPERLSGVPRDPYDVFDAWFDFFAEKNLCAQFNFLGERPRTSDCWYPLRHPFVQDLMQKIAARGHHIGFHPSYEAFENQAVFARELASLRAVAPVEITSGRQHYLRFAAPATWRAWAEAGLREDSTLGYAEAEGFRCGICHDFPVFDFLARRALPLREKPLVAMDVTLAQYRRYTPAQALERLARLRHEVEKHGGDFTILWHNSSWHTPTWESWQGVFERII